MTLNLRKLRYTCLSVVLILLSGCIETDQAPNVSQSPPALELEKVIDGDTFTLTSGEKVRISSIDTPEMYTENNIREAHSMQAYYRTKELLENNTFELRKLSSRNKDSYDRLLRNVYLLEKEEYLSKILIKEGLARVYYDTTLPQSILLEFCAMEKQSQKLQRNIWEAKSRGYFERKTPKCP